MVNKRNLFLVALYAGMFALPLCLLILGRWPGNAEFENRSPLKRPDLPWKDSAFQKSPEAERVPFSVAFHQYTKAWDDYFTEEFVLKKQLLIPYRRMKTSWFGVDPAPLIYIHGLNGWYFTGEWFTRTLSRGIGLDTLSEQQISNIVKRHVENMRVMDSMHIRYVILVVPDKHPVYREFLPMQYAKHPGMREQVVGALRQAGIEVLDVTHDLREARSLEHMYYKTDGHWTDAGAYQAYLRLFNHIQLTYPILKPLERKDFKMKSEHKVFPHFKNSTGDSTGEEIVRWAIRKRGFQLVSRSTRMGPGAIQSTLSEYNHPVNDLSLILFGDSFSTPLVNMLRENFGRTIHCLQCSVDTTMILRQKPDIVVFEVVQSNLENR